MPVVGEFHAKYWARQNADHTPPVLAAGDGGYPLWQSGNLLGSLFGPIGGWWDTAKQWVVWWARFAPRVHRLNREQRAIYLTVLDALESPAFPVAHNAVRQTAVILNFRDPLQWKRLGLITEMKSDVNRTENVYRHLEAVRRLRAGYPTPLRNTDATLITELAYTGFRLVKR